MKLKIVFDKNREEEILIFAHERTKMIDDIENLVKKSSDEIVGYSEGEASIIKASQTACFTVENNKVYEMLLEQYGSSKINDKI